VRTIFTERHRARHLPVRSAATAATPPAGPRAARQIIDDCTRDSAQQSLHGQRQVAE
jgi:hypothetical protein